MVIFQFIKYYIYSFYVDFLIYDFLINKVLNEG